MSDPWNIAADQKTAASRRAAEEQAAEQGRLRLAREKERVDQEAAHAALNDAIDEAVPLLETFMRERGEAAKRLLAASGDRAYIYIGGESEGGSYYSYYLSKDGLRYEIGRKLGYESKPDSTAPASARAVVEAYALEGGGRRDPAKVRAIVDWLTDKVNQYA